SRIDVVDSGHVLGRQKVVARLTGSEIWTNDAPWTPAADVRFGTKGGKIRDRLHHGRKRRRHADISRGSKMSACLRRFRPWCKRSRIFPPFVPNRTSAAGVQGASLVQISLPVSRATTF